MTMQYIRDNYGVPARRGGRVEFLGELATIVSAPDQYLRVRLDGSDKIFTVHPTWEIEYLDDLGAVQ